MKKIQGHVSAKKVMQEPVVTNVHLVISTILPALVSKLFIISVLKLT